jgi:hypothetical protein
MEKIILASWIELQRNQSQPSFGPALVQLWSSFGPEIGKPAKSDLWMAEFGTVQVLIQY